MDESEIDLGTVRISKGARRGAMLLLAVVLFMGCAAVTSSYLEWHHYADSQRAQVTAINDRLCSTLDKLAELKAPVGTGSDNPSRLYEQQLQATLSDLRIDIGCSP